MNVGFRIRGEIGRLIFENDQTLRDLNAAFRFRKTAVRVSESNESVHT